MRNSHQDKLAAGPIRLRRFVAALALSWTVAIGIVLAWEVSDEYDQAINIARNEAQGAWKKEAAVYRWAATTGGVWVPITPDRPPNPDLASIADRDVSTSSGRALTLISPPMIMREVHVWSRELSGIQGHISALHPIRPKNAPDPWEKNALEVFARGVPEVTDVEMIDGHRYLRYMRPLLTDASCLTCHVEQRYKVGDVRGGISISIPMTSVWGTQMPDVFHRLGGYGGMWLLGLCGIAVMSRQLKRNILRRQRAEEHLQEANALLEQRVAERTAELAESNRELESEIVERKQAEQWLLESEQRFRGYFEQGLVGMAILSAEREWVEVNGRLCKMLGYGEEELMLKAWADLAHPDDLAGEEAHFQRILGGLTRGFVIDKRFVRKDGAFLEAALSAQCLRNPDGSIDCLLLLVQDMAGRGFPADGKE